MGKKKAAFYRVIVQDSAFAPKGREVDQLGFYNPRLASSKLDVNKEKVLEWISKGAQPTESLRVLLGKAGILPPVSFEGKPKRAARVKGEAGAEGGAGTPAAAAPAAQPKAEKPAEEKKQ